MYRNNILDVECQKMEYFWNDKRKFNLIGQPQHFELLSKGKHKQYQVKPLRG